MDYFSFWYTNLLSNWTETLMSQKIWLNKMLFFITQIMIILIGHILTKNNGERYFTEPFCSTEEGFISTGWLTIRCLKNLSWIFSKWKSRILSNVFYKKDWHFGEQKGNFESWNKQKFPFVPDSLLDDHTKSSSPLVKKPHFGGEMSLGLGKPK